MKCLPQKLYSPDGIFLSNRKIAILSNATSDQRIIIAFNCILNIDYMKEAMFAFNLDMFVLNWIK